MTAPGKIPTLILEAAFGNTVADTSWSWTDLSTRIVRGSMRAGRSYELDQFQPSTLDVMLRNEDRQLDPTYASSIYYPNVKTRVPVRLRATYNHITSVHLPGATGDKVSTPLTLADATVVTLYWYGAFPDTTPAAEGVIAAKWGASGHQSFKWTLLPSGVMRFYVFDGSSHSADATAVLPYGDAVLGWLGVTWRTDTNLLRFHKGGAGTYPAWVQHGTDVTLTAGNITSSDAKLTIGADDTGAAPLHAYVQHVKVTNAFAGANPHVIDVDFTRDETWSSTTAVVDKYTNSWTLAGGATAVTSLTSFPQFWGYIDTVTQEFPGPGMQLCRLQATDGFKILSTSTLPSQWEQSVRGMSGLTHWYRLDQAADSGVYKDTIGTRSARENSGGIADAQHRTQSLVVGESNPSLQFSQATNDYLIWDNTSGSGYFPVNTAAFSVSFWVKLSTLASAGGHTYHILHTNNADYGLLIYVDSATNKMHFELNDNSPIGNNLVHDDLALSVGVSYFFTATYDGATTMKLFRDVGSTFTVDNPVSVAVTPLTNNVVGHLGSDTTVGVDGYLDELLVFNRAISQAEHQALCAAGSTSVDSTVKSTTVADTILDYAGWPSTLRSYPGSSGATTVVEMKWDSPQDRRALDYLQELARTERGAVYIDAAGILTFETDLFLQSDGSRYVSDPLLTQVTLGDDTTSIPYRWGVSYSHEEQSVRNEARITNTWVRPDTAGGFVTSEEGGDRRAASITDHGIITYKLNTKYQKSSLLLIQSTISQRADQELNRYSDEYVRFGDVKLVGDNNPDKYWPAILAIRPLTQVTMVLAPPVGPAITRIRGVAEVRTQFVCIGAALGDYNVTLKLDLGQFPDP